MGSVKGSFVDSKSSYVVDQLEDKISCHIYGIKHVDIQHKIHFPENHSLHCIMTYK